MPGRRRLVRTTVAIGALAALAGSSRGELLSSPESVRDRPLRLTFEILPADRERPLPDELRSIEGGRFAMDETMVNGVRYVRASVVFPLSGGDRLERIVLFADEGGKLRMLGVHALRRHLETPEGETLVFQSGQPNPLNGRSTSVPADTYTYLGLAAALRGTVGEPRPFGIHLILMADAGGARAARITPEGDEELSLFGTKVATRRFRVALGEHREGEAHYWFGASPPYPWLQYRGPADFLPTASDRAPEVILRATSSSEQTQRLFGGIPPAGFDPAS
jgi:hypothetical protein